MSREQEQNLRELAESAAKLPEGQCAVLAGIAKGMEISAGMRAQEHNDNNTRTA